MKTKIFSALLLLTSACLFAFALSTSHREAAMACWVVSTIFFIAAAMLILGAIVGASSATCPEARRKRRS